jgi:hypothetical protein
MTQQDKIIKYDIGDICQNKGKLIKMSISTSNIEQSEFGTLRKTEIRNIGCPEIVEICFYQLPD